MPKKEIGRSLILEFQSDLTLDDKIQLIDIAIRLIIDHRRKIQNTINDPSAQISIQHRNQLEIKLNRYDRYYAELESWRAVLLHVSDEEEA